MNLVQRSARNVLLPLLFAALSSPALRADALQAPHDLARSEFASSRVHATALARPDLSALTGNLALVTQIGYGLTGGITQIGKAMEASMLQSGYAHEASIEQHGSHNQGLIVHSGASNQPALNSTARTTPR
jgi:minor curlin subunit